MADNYIDITQDASGAIKALGNAKSKIEELLLQGMEKALLMIESDAKKNCPVDEGRLRASITHDKEAKDDEIIGRVGTNVEYAPYVEMGTGIYAQNGDGRKTPWIWEGDSVKWKGEHLTRGQKPKRFLQNAVDSNREKIGEVFKETMEGLK
ncbi:HK97-gp10 family putative phage morphogenesis protein [Clostridium thermosuccinogenes]|uniref:HK97-gp10 family putative phage morphogenesis protein n=1 Tax=Clostridium thermosuccinogenes TaxID=84032 RepID=UPI000CCC9444|nr:HK97-gp10 family putative phage morphogenesis protein [Pseudoclostridium thermosuccinogenes]PNT94150.1 hypothetical protein CDQ83_11925 [Pseudoclostridium thermosuccinogenes]